MTAVIATSRKAGRPKGSKIDPTANRRIPFAPLLDRVDRWILDREQGTRLDPVTGMWVPSDKQRAEVLNIDGEVLARYRRRDWIPAYLADVLATDWVGHPALVWPDWYDLTAHHA